MFGCDQIFSNPQENSDERGFRGTFQGILTKLSTGNGDNDDPSLHVANRKADPRHQRPSP
jgi:hypothetical protein